MASLAITNAHVVPVEGEPVRRHRRRHRRPDLRGRPQGQAAAPKAEVVDAEGGWVLPGFIDAHTHVGVWGEGEGWSGQDTNEMTDPVTAQVRALDAINPGDLGFTDALAGGIMAVNVNPGSGNPIGGHCVAVHTHGRTVDEMVLRSPAGLKSALGENPKRVYGDQKKTPSTRLGTAAVIREAFVGRAELPGQARGGRRRRRSRSTARPQAGGAGDGARPRDPLAPALPPRRRHRDGHPHRRRVRLRAGHRPRHRGAPDRRPDRRARASRCSSGRSS